MSPQPTTLVGIPMFKSLKRADIEALDARCDWRRVAAKEWVIDYQDDGSDVFFVVSGAVRVLIYAKSGREVILADLVGGGFFGEMAPLDGHSRSASVLAVADAVVATMPGTLFLEVLNSHPSVSMFVMKHLAARVRQLDNRVLEFSTLDVWHRVSCELLRLARPDPTDARRGVLSPAPTQAEIAARVSTSREAVVREMKSLEREGFLQRQRDGLVLTDVPRLVQRLETD
ncbi:MAG: Crp/Fnr family transcriptional regulator [Hyphomicrobiales bacterium]